jgi:hypothetical protein
MKLATGPKTLVNMNGTVMSVTEAARGSVGATSFFLNRAGDIAPGAIASVDVPIDAGSAFAPARAGSYEGYPYTYYNPGAPVGTHNVWSLTGDLAGRRSMAIEEWLSQDPNLVCVYAECGDPQPEVKLLNQAPIETHWQVIRALFPLEPR